LSLKAYTAEHIFTGEEWLTDHAIIVEDGIITNIFPKENLSGEAELIQVPHDFLAPAFIDLQIYGAHGKLLAVYPEPGALADLRDYCRSGGAAWCMPTVATNTYDVFFKCIDAVRDYWAQGGEGVLGLHIEGPWINPVRRGAHIEALIHSPTIEQARRLLDYGKDVIRIITLAPEQCSDAVIDLILSHGIIISAGHSNATLKEANEGFDKGIGAVTHLYNAMSPLHHRQPGLVGASMLHDGVMASVIPDGYHVDYPAIRIAKEIMKERLFVITDAVTDTNKGHYQHVLAGDKYEAAGILSGSALTMGKAYFNLCKHVGISRAEALRMCSLYPARVLQKDGEMGRLAAGYPFSVVAVNEKQERAVLLY
jgi:N-acetylglucosamine-6-phosphate deacetylase